MKHNDFEKCGGETSRRIIIEHSFRTLEGKPTGTAPVLFEQHGYMDDYDFNNLLAGLDTRTDELEGFCSKTEQTIIYKRTLLILTRTPLERKGDL